MIIRGGHRAQRIMLAIDGSDHARAAEDSVAQLPWIETVDVAVIGITETGKHAKAVWESEKRLAAVANTTTAQVLGPDELQVFYRPSDTILEAAKKWNADIVALGSRGLSSWETIGEVGLRRAGSCAIAVAQSARCSVMLGRAQP
jgi:nucleotide-binding universal stress UspA family protein